MLKEQVIQTLRKTGVCPEHSAVIEMHFSLIVDATVDAMRMHGYTISEPPKADAADDETAGGGSQEG